ncbi:MAG: hypothetical protein LBI29_00235, partial [Rickettsiales bacterium]|nr:hypothetical protein [Rickettsiales bacterium]
MFSFLDSIYNFNKGYLSPKSKTKVSGRYLTGICLLLLWFGSGVAGIARAESNDGITEITGPVRLELG